MISGRWFLEWNNLKRKGIFVNWQIFSSKELLRSIFEASRASFSSVWMHLWFLRVRSNLRTKKEKSHHFYYTSLACLFNLFIVSFMTTNPKKEKKKRIRTFSWTFFIGPSTFRRCFVCLFYSSSGEISFNHHIPYSIYLLRCPHNCISTASSSSVITQLKEKKM